MSAQYFDPACTGYEIGSVQTLPDTEAHHAVNVVKLQQGETLTVFDGEGTQLFAEIIETPVMNATILQYLVQDQQTTPKPKPEIVLVQALAKGGRDELAIQTACELGVSGIIPWQADRSIVKWRADKQDRNLNRWQEILRDAAKQSLNPFLPKVHPLIQSKQLETLSEHYTVIVLDPRAKETFSDWIKTVATSIETPATEEIQNPIALIVGPEGGISEPELDILEQHGAQLLSLGKYVMRSSSAGAAALAIINHELGRWKR